MTTIDSTAEEFLAYPEPVREAARNLLIQCRTGYTADVLPHLARLIAGPSAEALAEHVPVVDEFTGYPATCQCGETGRTRFHRDEDGNLLKDEVPDLRWAAHAVEAIRVG